MTSGWQSGYQGPKAPANGIVSSPFIRGAWDIRWDDPSLLCENDGLEIVGVNIYRSDASDRGPFHRINPYPIGSQFYRDQTSTRFIFRETVLWSAWQSKGETSNNGEWIFCTQYPIVKSGSLNVPATSPHDVKVEINGVEVPVHQVYGPDRRVHLMTLQEWDVRDERFDTPPFPQSENDVVTVTYHTEANTVQTSLGRKTFYRLVTVSRDSAGGLIETPLEHSPPLSSFEIEKLDYIWKEAIRRNLWILQQGGERAKVFVQKTAGLPCDCGRDRESGSAVGQPRNSCKRCFGTGILGGYEGPYEIIIAPDEQERRFSQTPMGRRLEHAYEVWTGPQPVLTQRDFIVRQTNERYTIGPVRRPSVRGASLQQHFNIQHIPESDVRYEVPVYGTDSLAWPETRNTDQIVTGDPCQMRHDFENQPIPTGPDSPVTPMATEKGNIPDDREQRGRTRVWENLTY